MALIDQNEQTEKTKARISIVKGHEESFPVDHLLFLSEDHYYILLLVAFLMVFCWSSVHHVIIFLKVVFSFYIHKGIGLSSVSLSIDYY